MKLNKRANRFTGQWGARIGLNARGPSAKQRGVRVSLPVFKFMEKEPDKWDGQQDGKKQ